MWLGRPCVDHGGSKCIWVDLVWIAVGFRCVWVDLVWVAVDLRCYWVDFVWIAVGLGVSGSTLCGLGGFWVYLG